MSTLRLAHAPGFQGDGVLKGERGVPKLPVSSSPAILISYVYVEPFLREQEKFTYRDWALDSGAFSAHNSGTAVDLNSYIDCAGGLQENDPTLADVFSLDDIGDWRASIRNAEEMWRAGVRAIPTYHYGEPERVLDQLADEYPKIALGGTARTLRGGEKMDWFGQCFARLWRRRGPTKVHGFGVFSERLLMAYPFHSVDATSWEISPCGFGHWRGFGGQRVSVRGSAQNLRIEVEHYLGLERRMRQRWAKEMASMEEIDAEKFPAVRLSVSDVAGRSRQWLGGPPR